MKIAFINKMNGEQIRVVDCMYDCCVMKPFMKTVNIIMIVIGLWLLLVWMLVPVLVYWEE